MNKDQIATLDQHFTRWEVEGAAGELRYQATPKGSIMPPIMKRPSIT